MNGYKEGIVNQVDFLSRIVPYRPVRVHRKASPIGNDQATLVEIYRRDDCADMWSYHRRPELHSLAS
jgi:hypothetical protein